MWIKKKKKKMMHYVDYALAISFLMAYSLLLYSTTFFSFFNIPLILRCSFFFFCKSVLINYSSKISVSLYDCTFITLYTSSFFFFFFLKFLLTAWNITGIYSPYIIHTLIRKLLMLFILLCGTLVIKLVLF